MKTRRLMAVVVIVGALLAVVVVSQGAADDGLTPEQELGELLYFDEDLSHPDGQACASCHTPDVGFDDPDSELPVSEGIHEGRFGDRNSPMSAYAMYAPIFYYEDVEGLFIGGQFWDGRATGEVLGDPLADQALGPFLNPVEMANDMKQTVVRDARTSDYKELFKEVCGAPTLDDGAYVEDAYDCIADSIAAFERTELFGEFSSKYDAYLQACLAAGGTPDGCAQGTGKVAQQVGKKFFSAAEWKGFELFMNPVNDNDGKLTGQEGAMCVLCHVADWTDPGALENEVVVPEWAPDGMVPPMFTDFTYDNLGVPKNWDNPFLYQSEEFNPGGEDFIDLGLYRFLEGRPDLWPEKPADDQGWELAGEMGKFKVMTLRNIGMTAPYAHNGLFGSLEEITHFYNTRDALGVCESFDDPGFGETCWPAAEVPETVNFDELGNLGLSAKDEAALVAFMETLSDGYTE